MTYGDDPELTDLEQLVEIQALGALIEAANTHVGHLTVPEVDYALGVAAGMATQRHGRPGP